MPLAALARLNGDMIRLEARLASPDGSELLEAGAEGSVDTAEALGYGVAESLLEQGGERILSQL